VLHSFIGFDDNEFVYENRYVVPGFTLSGVWWALSAGTFGEWSPLATFSHMLDCQLYGVNPAGHYLTNLLLHAVSSVLLFLVLRRMTGDLWPSAWVAAIFAIHPMHVESVAWIAERRDVLSGLFFMLTLGAYTLYAERPKLIRYLAVAGCLTLGLMTKATLVTVPCLLLLLDYWPLGRFGPMADASKQAASPAWIGRLPVGWRLVVEKLPLFVLAAASCGITLWTHASTSSTNPVEQFPLSTRLANGLVAYATYVGQSFYPADLTPFYPHPGTGLPMVSVAGALTLLLAISIVAALFWRRLPCLLVGWLWFVGMLVPVSGLVQLVAIARADRYTYLSQIGLSIALAWCVWSFYQSRQSLHEARWRRWTLAALSGGVVLALAVTAWRQTSHWRNAETLWTHTLACTERNQMAHHNLAFFYVHQGRTEEAITHLRAALEAGSINSLMMAMSHGVLGECLTKQGKNEEALEEFEQAVHTYPNSEPGHGRLADVLDRAGQHERAIVHWREAIRLAPMHAAPRLGLANTLLAEGKGSEAAAECRDLLKLVPNSAEAIITLGLSLATEGRNADAVLEFEQATKLDPRNARAHFVLGLALYDLGRPLGAIEHLHEAMRLQPDNALGFWRTAWILATSPDPAVRNGAHAVELANRSIELSGGQDPHAFDALAAALAEIKNFPAAIQAADQASALALSRGDKALVDAIGERGRLYRQDLPYREPPSTRAHAP
jgi:tetratricopeptide (TPR) repeat protein